MEYADRAIPDTDCPRAANPLLQHVLDVYVSEINKVAVVWRSFDQADLGYRPHERSQTVEGIFKHELLSARRFFSEFLGFPEPSADAVLPPQTDIASYTMRMTDLARARLPRLASQDDGWWLERVPFFDVTRERIWIFWRRVLHTAHHRTQLTVYLRLLGKPVPAVYGPTADVSWSGADPTTSVQAASRK
jgi:uncharacterized damage-inducible protein DinB